MDKEKLLEAYERVIMLNEGTEEDQIVKALEKLFGIKVRKVEVRKTIDIDWKGTIDQDDPKNFDKIDGFEEFVEKKMKKKGMRTFVKWNNWGTAMEIKQI